MPINDRTPELVVRVIPQMPGGLDTAYLQISMQVGDQVHRTRVRIPPELDGTVFEYMFNQAREQLRHHMLRYYRANREERAQMTVDQNAPRPFIFNGMDYAPNPDYLAAAQAQLNEAVDQRFYDRVAQVNIGPRPEFRPLDNWVPPVLHRRDPDPRPEATIGGHPVEAWNALTPTPAVQEALPPIGKPPVPPKQS